MKGLTITIDDDMADQFIIAMLRNTGDTAIWCIRQAHKSLAKDTPSRTRLTSSRSRTQRRCTSRGLARWPRSAHLNAMRHTSARAPSLSADMGRGGGGAGAWPPARDTREVQESSLAEPVRRPAESAVVFAALVLP